MSKYKLNVSRDVDTDEGVYILNLPKGFRFDDAPFSQTDSSHVQGFDTMAEVRAAARYSVTSCTCNSCTKHN